MTWDGHDRTGGDLRASFEALLEATPAYVVALAPDGTIEYVNHSLLRPRDAIVGRSWLTFFPPDRHALLAESLRSVIAGATIEVEAPMDGLDGRTLVLSMHIAPLRAGGAIVGAALVARDISHRKREQAELLANHRMASLGGLVAGIAHEINTPIQFVGDSVEFLRDATTDLLRACEQLPAPDEVDLAFLTESIPAALQRCSEGLERVASIVRSLQEIGNPARKQMTPTDLNHAIQSTLVIATSVYKYVAELKTEFGDLPPVTCNAGEIGQAVLGIVANAAQSIGDVVAGTQDKGTITVRTHAEADAAVIAITDTGAGIPEDVRPRIFDPFFTTKDVGRGVGQGLAIVWSTITEQHRGSIDVETEVGRGTTFTIRLPFV